MDKIDRKILAELQADGRLSVTELAERIGLSVSPCHRRVRALEESGVIRGYRAQLDPGSWAITFPPRCSSPCAKAIAAPLKPSKTP